MIVIASALTMCPSKFQMGRVTERNPTPGIRERSLWAIVNCERITPRPGSRSCEPASSPVKQHQPSADIREAKNVHAPPVSYIRSDPSPWMQTGILLGAGG